METDTRLLLLSPDDNVFVLRAAIEAGETIVVGGQKFKIQDRIGLGHKIASRAIKKGDNVLKYGASIGSATCEISPGDHVHLQNLQSNYTPTYSLDLERTAHSGARK
ncbi:MAG: UxaA family hydrolase [Alphaproteobacteria bacterium]|jgi:hypothetical protein|nr:UxaA family hydrolase [Alphaproteobacteria bacterium]|tara:strand:+ start:13315 stop:13635 length:321 start_codon:yes stop_codon:yes gene_type:complete